MFSRDLLLGYCFCYVFHKEHYIYIPVSFCSQEELNIHREVLERTLCKDNMQARVQSTLAERGSIQTRQQHIFSRRGDEEWPSSQKILRKP